MSEKKTKEEDGEEHERTSRDRFDADGSVVKGGADTDKSDNDDEYDADGGEQLLGSGAARRQQSSHRQDASRQPVDDLTLTEMLRTVPLHYYTLSHHRRRFRAVRRHQRRELTTSCRPTACSAQW